MSNKLFEHQVIYGIIDLHTISMVAPNMIKSIATKAAQSSDHNLPEMCHLENNRRARKGKVIQNNVTTIFVR